MEDFKPTKSVERAPISFRKASLKDVNLITELRKSVASPYAFRDIENNTETQEGVSKDISTVHVYLIEEGDSVIGSVGYERKDSDPDNAFISSFLIKPEFQNQGVGKVAFNAVLKQLQGCKRIEIHTGQNNEKMLSLLLSSGFVKESEYQIDNGENIFRLVLRQEDEDKAS